MIEQITNDLRKGIVCWCDFLKTHHVLCIMEKNHPIIEYISDKCNSITAVSGVEELTQIDTMQYDVIISIGVLEYLNNPVEILKQLKQQLTNEGKLLLAVENRLGLKYFLGDKDPYTKRNFDGIEAYLGAGGKNRGTEGRNYSKNEISIMLNEAGFQNQKYYSVLPNLEFAQLVYSEDYLPQEELSGRYFPKYNSPQTIFLNEESLYSDLIANDMFHQMANAYLIECPIEPTFMEVKHATISIERGRQQAMSTIIYNNNIVGKKAIFKEGNIKLSQLKDNEAYLKNRGIKVVEGIVQNNSYDMPFVTEMHGVKFMQSLFYKDRVKFEAFIDDLYCIVMKSSNIVAEDEVYGSILERGYVDLVPLNAFVINGEFVFYDQEFYYTNYPAKAIFYRVITIIYNQNMNEILPMMYFWKKYNMDENLENFATKQAEFTTELRNVRELAYFWKPFNKDYAAIHANRQRMNYSLDEYDRIFKNIFNNIDGKKIILFGSGLFAKHFVNLYGRELQVDGIVDNNSSKWGDAIEGVTIKSPDILQGIELDDYRIIICVKQYYSIVNQLHSMGIKEYCIYDRGMTYNRPIISKNSDIQGNKVKKYKRGYISGVFDMFHIGHLNLIKKAKEQCEYLIVGVVSDKGVRENKKVEPVIPFEQRLEIVASCKYVDEAVEIPFGYAGTQDAYKIYQFDCQFSGSDYIDNPAWLSEKAFLETKGVTMVFFPYTESISSSKLKKQMGIELIKDETESKLV